MAFVQIWWAELVYSAKSGVGNLSRSTFTGSEFRLSMVTRVIALIGCIGNFNGSSRACVRLAKHNSPSLGFGPNQVEGNVMVGTSTSG